MDVSEARELARRLMAQHGLIVRGWTFNFNRRKRALGLCNYTDKRIELSVYFIVMNDIPEVVDTIRHEIAHALAGQDAGHGPAWAAICQRLGAIPKPTCSDAAMPRGMYRSRCSGCGEAYDRFRRPKRGFSYYCATCGPKGGKLRFVRKQPDPAEPANRGSQNPTPEPVAQQRLW